MSSTHKNLSAYMVSEVPDARLFKFGIVVSDYNSEITYALLEACVTTLQKHGAMTEAIAIWHVPGVFELPLAAQTICDAENPDAVICLGCVITGETKHDEYINKSVAQALMQLGLSYATPIIFGVLTPQNIEQAQDRAGGKHGNKGVEAAIAAIRMADLLIRNRV
ncbi:MAG: 6,7-dimethyl-8-ribityllumazine synthase [Chitinophagales bacterium]|jgi:6,7-dimethyl-8-ribityllumazine synthase|nr:6,7-dimethyl-8-ribityllumazine synthase [Sphingobacteriales bacterium]MBP7534357.1 6,7-dimethyl-8-ribityllumazine synthase [Chitinophagales bacterium]